MRQNQGEIKVLLAAQPGNTDEPETEIASGTSSAVDVGELTEAGAGLTPDEYADHILVDADGREWTIESHTDEVFTLTAVALTTEEADDPPTPTAGAYSIYDPTLFQDMLEFTGGMLVAKWLITVSIGGTGTCKLAMWGKDRYGKRWGACGENEGLLNLGVAIPAGARRHFIIENLGVFNTVQMMVSDSTGSPEVSAWLSEIVENSYTKGD